MTTRADLQAALGFFIAHGWTPAQAAGIVANLVAESNLNPAAVGDGGQAYGIAQWHGDRQANFAALIGKDIHGSSLEDQLAFVHGELQGSEKAAGDALRATTTAAEAGAVVSDKYERPANQAAEAARRAVLAESIFTDEESQPSTPAAPAVQQAASQPSPQPGAPMGAIATFLPLILQLIPALTGSKGLQSVVGAVSGQAPPVALGAAPPTGGSLHAGDYIALAQTILSTFVNAIPAAQGNPALAVGMAQTDPAAAKAASDAVLAHPDVVAELNAQVPVFDAIAKYDKATNDAVIAGRASALAAQQADTSGTVPALVQRITWQDGAILAGLFIALVGAIVAKVVNPDVPDYVSMIIGPLGMAIGAKQKEMGAIVAFFFDGTPASNATAAVNQQIATMNATKP